MLAVLLEFWIVNLSLLLLSHPVKNTELLQCVKFAVQRQICFGGVKL